MQENFESNLILRRIWHDVSVLKVQGRNFAI